MGRTSSRPVSTQVYEVLKHLELRMGKQIVNVKVSPDHMLSDQLVVTVVSNKVDALVKSRSCEILSFHETHC